MSIARIAVTAHTFEPHSPSGEAVRARGFWAYVWDWLIETQTRRAEDVVRAHPEWDADPSAAYESPSPDSRRRALHRVGYWSAACW